MPQQLIYTSAPRGLVAGRSGYCTVARSASMREALVLRLEQLSYYHHLSLGGAVERPIFAHRIVDIRGTRFHVLSRIQDAGLDFTGRTNFIAHHVAVTPNECCALPSPPVILRDWNGWKQQWSADPQLLENEDWSGLAALAGLDSLPAQTWKRVTGDAVNGCGLLELAAAVRVNGQSNETLLGLLAESLELLEMRDRRQDRRTAAWQFTFTTSLQEQDNPGDFRWRFIQADAPARLTAGEGRAIEAVTASSCTDEEAVLARVGRQPPRFIVEPQNAQVCDGETARLRGEAEGVPLPSYQWSTVDRQNNAQAIDGATAPELVLANPPRGVSRYVLTIKNSSGEAVSRPAVLSVELKLSVGVPSIEGANPAVEPKPYQKSAEQIEEQRERLEARELEQRRNRRMFLRNLFLIALAFVIIGGAASLLVLPRLQEQGPAASRSPSLLPPVAKSVKNPKPSPLLPPPASVPSRQQQQLAMNDASPPLLSNQAIAIPPIATHDAKDRITMARPEKVNLPPRWHAIGIGGVSRTNCEYLPDERPPEVAMSAAAAGFGQGGDNVLFVCTNSQKQFTAALSGTESPAPENGCGIMVRESSATNSPFLFIGASSNKVLVYLRDTDGNFYSKSADRTGSRMRLTIEKNEIGLYNPLYSFGLQSFTFPNFSIRLRDNSLIGFALASGNVSNVATARFAMAMADQKSGGRAITE